MNSSFFSISPVILAHRGDSKFFPENTMPAFKSASDLGVDCIETDAHLTIDGICILWHDDTVKTETGEELRICSTTFDELKRSMPAGSTQMTAVRHIHSETRVLE